MGCPKPSPEVAAMTEECIAEARPRLSYKVCWREFAISGAGADGRPHTDERPCSDGRPGGVMIPEAQTDEAAGSQSGASLDLGRARCSRSRQGQRPGAQDRCKQSFHSGSSPLLFKHLLIERMWKKGRLYTPCRLSYRGNPLVSGAHSARVFSPPIVKIG